MAMNPFLKRLTLGVTLAAIALSILRATASAEPQKTKNETLKGQVKTLAGVLEKAGAKLDPDASPTSLVLVADDGKIYPLVKDDGSRLFYKDDRLLNRDMRLTARLVPNSQFLQVVTVESYNKKGDLCDLFYWCDICSIRRGEKMKCECCGGPMELREVPVKK
jgi:hypothetical protein